MSDKRELSGEERRRHKRIEDSFLVSYQLHSKPEGVFHSRDREYDAVALDVSVGGLGIDAGQEIPVGSRLQLRFNILNENPFLEKHRQRRFEVEGESRYCRQSDRYSYRIGILFRNLTEEDRAFLADYVRIRAFAAQETGAWPF